MSKSKSPLYIRNFGVGKYVSPIKETDEDKEEKTNKPTIIEKGGDSAKADKGWLKAAKHATNVLSTALGSVYGGNVNIQKINRKSDDDVKDEVDNQDPGEDLNSQNTENKIDELLGSEDGGFSNFITNAEQGNEFRKWVNDNHPEEAKNIGKNLGSSSQMGLDASGSHTNAYIKEAWKKYGSEFAKRDGQSMEDQHKTALPMVSPLKRKRGQRGKSATRGKSTSTRKRRGGFTRGNKGGKNPGFYNVQTRFSPRDTSIQPIKGGVSGGGGDGKPYSYDKMGNMVFSPTIINNVGGDGKDAYADAWSKSGSEGPQYEWVPPEYGQVNKKLPTYRESWDANNKNVQSKYATFEEYEKAAKEWNRKHGVKTSSERVKIKDGYYKEISPGSSWSESGSSAGVKFKGKLKLGGYRTMHGK